MVQTGSARTSANSFNNQFGNPSGPEAFTRVEFSLKPGRYLIQTEWGARTPRHKEQRIAEVGRLAWARGKRY